MQYVILQLIILSRDLKTLQNWSGPDTAHPTAPEVSAPPLLLVPKGGNPSHSLFSSFPLFSPSPSPSTFSIFALYSLFSSFPLFSTSSPSTFLPFFALFLFPTLRDRREIAIIGTQQNKILTKVLTTSTTFLSLPDVNIYSYKRCKMPREQIQYLHSNPLGYKRVSTAIFLSHPNTSHLLQKIHQYNIQNTTNNIKQAQARPNALFHYCIMIPAHY